ncbi:hypothetical protein CC2G_004374 [Coprinopsis cinerea AmutBmut pab1-1]|nr:hypothetical protein CC2G_004374 [Coprinopsis cinerea AmutBmut pab1-1]
MSYSRLRYRSDRRFLVADHDDIAAKAAEIVHVLLSVLETDDVDPEAPSTSSLTCHSHKTSRKRQELRNSVNTVGPFIYEAGISASQTSRTVALVAEATYTVLHHRGYPEVAEEFRDELESLAIEGFNTCWTTALSPSYHSLRRSSCTEDDLLSTSSFLGDLYAMGLLSPSSLQSSVELIADNFTDPYFHIACMVVIISRAMSYSGLRIELGWFIDIVEVVRTRCEMDFGFEHMCETEEFLASLVHSLSRDASASSSDFSAYCELPFFHDVDHTLRCDDIFEGEYLVLPGTPESVSYLHALPGSEDYEEDDFGDGYSDETDDIAERLARFGIREEDVDDCEVEGLVVKHGGLVFASSPEETLGVDSEGEGYEA